MLINLGWNAPSCNTSAQWEAMTHKSYAPATELLMNKFQNMIEMKEVFVRKCGFLVLIWLIVFGFALCFCAYIFYNVSFLLLRYVVPILFSLDVFYVLNNFNVDDF